MEPSSANPKGYWEHCGFVEINDEILARFGGSCIAPPAFPSGWETSPELQDLRERAHRLVEEEFRDSPSWGWKDPRTCLTLPFWQQLLPVMRYIICIRNPADVAHSLNDRDHCDFARSSRLWLHYVNAALRSTAGYRRIMIFYEDIMLDWSSQLNVLSCFLNGESAVVKDETRSQAAAFVDGELHHHATALVQNLSHPQVAFEAKALYLLLQLRVREDGPRGASVLPHRLVEVFAQQASGSAERSQRLEARYEQCERQLAQLTVEHGNLDTRRQNVERQLLSEQGRAQDLLVARGQLEERLAQELKRVSETQEASQRLSNEVHRLEEMAKELAGERASAQVKVEELSARLHDIENSLAWRAIEGARATKDFLLPHGTPQRRIYDVGLNSAKSRVLQKRK